MQFGGGLIFLEAIFGIRELGAGDLRLKDPEELYREILAGSPVSIRLKPGAKGLKSRERGLLELTNIVLREPRSVRRGVYGGPSVRVGGMPIRLGAFQSESHEALREIDRGTLILTDRRLVFMGEKKNANIPLSKILRVQSGDGEIAVQREDRQRVQYFGRLGGYAEPVERVIMEREL